MMHSAFTRPSNRHGATLTEVLASILVMSIGVVLLATLFPISILQTVKATQQTRATMLRFNAEALMDTNPELVLPLPYDPNSPPPPVWQPNTAYNEGDLVLWTNKRPQLAWIFRCTAVSQAPVGAQAVSGMREPFWNSRLGELVVDNEIEWRATIVMPRRYFVDPWGWHEIRAADGSAPADGSGNLGISDWMGNDNGSTVNNVLRRYRGFPALTDTTSYPDAGNLIGARALVTSPDSWVLHSEDIRESVTVNTTNPTTTTITMPSNFDGSDVLVAPVGSSRVVFLDGDRRAIAGEVRSISGIAGTTITCVGALPNTFPASSVERVRIETRDFRYSYMLTVHLSHSGTAQVYAVVFFNRAFTAEDEHTFPTVDFLEYTNARSRGPDNQPGVAGVDDDGVNGVDDIGELGWPDSDDVRNDTILVDYSAGPGRPVGMKKGGWVLDPVNANWYLIREVIDDEANMQATVRFVRGIQEDSTHAVIMRGVVDVFALKPRDVGL